MKDPRWPLTPCDTSHNMQKNPKKTKNKQTCGLPCDSCFRPYFTQHTVHGWCARIAM